MGRASYFRITLDDITQSLGRIDTVSPEGFKTLKVELALYLRP